MQQTKKRARARAVVGQLASISRSGRIAAFRRPGAVELCFTSSQQDTGRERRLTIDAPGASDFGFGAGGLWVLGGGYVHWMTEEGETQLSCLVGDRVKRLRPSRSALPSCVLEGRGTDLCELYDGQLFAFPLVLGTRAGEQVFPIGPRLLAVATHESLRIVHLERGNLFAHAIPEGNSIRSIDPVFGGSAIAVVTSGTQPKLWLLAPTGERLHDVSIGRPDLIAVAEDRGIVVVATGNTLCSIDVRHGETREWAETPFAIHGIDICARARNLVLAQHNGSKPRTWHVRYSDIFSETL